jgi:UDP-N-acetylglucosamine 2-epimerase (non-hydrolysing)
LKKVLFVFGTRPEVIKLAPVILRIRQFPDEFEICLCNTAQHRNMIQEPLDLFGLDVDMDLDIMRANQDLFDITQRLVKAFKESVFPQFKPDQVIIQGDTTTTMVAALSGFYAGIPVAHVEAGLRTYRMDSPFPEEFNRRVCSLIANQHFCPTEWARKNLLREGVTEEKIHVTGNTSIDSVLWVLGKYDPESIRKQNKNQKFEKFLADWNGERFVLITLHRREHFGPSFIHILEALKALANHFPNVGWVYPVHPNPNVREPAYQRLSSVSNICLLEPLDYLSFVHLMKSCTLVLTDSGGVQEEAPSLGKPVLVIRETTERPEGIEAGTAKLVGVKPQQIIDAASMLLNDSAEYQKMAKIKNPYGDGRAAERIVEVLRG